MAFFAIGAAGLEAQVSGTLTGRVVDGGGPVESAAVRLLEGPDIIAGVGSDVDGRFTIDGLAPGQYTLGVTRIGLADFTRLVTIVADSTTTVEVRMRPAAIALSGIAVEGRASREREVFEESAGVTTRELSSADIRLVPGLSEADPIRAIEVLPGVVSTSDFTSAFNVRGGSADQNLILLDGIPIFSPFHLGGVFSVFNPDMVGRAELRSGGFGAEYGGRVSSVLRIESDLGDGEFGVDAGVSLLSSRATVRDGFADGRGRWRISARRSYFDVLFAPVADIPYHLQDLQGAFEWRTGDRSRLRISGYTGADVVDFSTVDEETFPLRIDWDWGNDLIGASWVRLFDRGQLTLGTSWTRFDTGLGFPDFDDTSFRSSIDQLSSRAELVMRASDALEISVGTSLDRLGYDNLARTGGTVFAEGAGDGDQIGAFAQARWTAEGRWIVEAGARLDHWRPDPGDPVTEAAPRLAVKRFLADGTWALKGSVGRYTQFLHSLRDEELPIGLDIWVLSGRRAPHVVSDQIQFGVEALPDGDWTFSAEAYWREFDGVVTFNNGDDPNTDTDDILPGTGTSYGLDLFARRNVGEWTGWASLSLLKAERTFPDFLSPDLPIPDVTYAPIFDKSVDLDVVLRFPAIRGWSGGLRLNVGRGTPYTRPGGSYAFYQPRFLNDGGRLVWSGVDQDDDDGGGYAVLLEDRNSERYPIYHRLDVGFRRSFEKSWGTITPTIDFLNVYNRRNPLFYFFEYDRDPPVRSGVSMFPLLPTFGVEVTF
ncbi:MAG TPA: TonB-dependent receptor [Longimicrobiales bacterium]|nr:TonB-dependent receptor [Longimicrobiales bacterium]